MANKQSNQLTKCDIPPQKLAFLTAYRSVRTLLKHEKIQKLPNGDELRPALESIYAMIDSMDYPQNQYYCNALLSHNRQGKCSHEELDPSTRKLFRRIELDYLRKGKLPAPKGVDHV